MILYGAISVKYAINGHKRTIEKVLIDSVKIKKKKDLQYIYHLALDNDIEVQVVDEKVFHQYELNKTYGGIIAISSNRQIEMISSASLEDKNYICLLDGIEDPYNMGYALRNLYASGCDLVIINNRSWDSVDNIITLSSAGASELLDIVYYDEMNNLLPLLQEFKLYATYRNNAIAYQNANYCGKICIAFGGEKRGIAKDFIKAADQCIFIPYANDFRNALNASSAVAVVAFEILRQKGGK
ncbi:MAG: TrmH family RNA methyltransferase [Erysipelotrichaceae bacterium]